MGRKLEFSKEKALHTAMERFWEQGYVATSMRDLAQRLGLHLGSVYNALGDKERVFEASLRLNLEQYVIPRLKRMSEAPDALAALDGYMTEVLNECSNPGGSPGCFLINSLLEIGNINDGITALLNDYVGQMQKAFAETIRRAQTAGQIPMSKNPEEYAHFLMAAMFSMRALAKLKAPADYIRHTRDCAVRALTTV